MTTYQAAIEFAETLVPTEWEERYVVGLVAIDPPSIEKRITEPRKRKRTWGEREKFEGLRQSLVRRLAAGVISAVDARRAVEEAGYSDGVFVAETREELRDAIVKVVVAGGNCWATDGDVEEGVFSVLFWYDKSHERTWS